MAPETDGSQREEGNEHECAAMVKRIAEMSARPRARLTGVIYLLFFLTAISAEFFLPGRNVVVYRDAANLISIVCYIAVTLLFYDMFRPVNRSLSLVAALFSLLGCAVLLLNLFDPSANSISSNLFFGPYCLLVGYLIFRSTFLPQILGVLMALAGLGWLIFLLPPLVNHMSSYIEGLGIVAEGSLMLWLLIVGVDVHKWEEKAQRMH
jgi:Domain of unknown function (DUF4386)